MSQIRETYMQIETEYNAYERNRIQLHSTSNAELVDLNSDQTPFGIMLT